MNKKLMILSVILMSVFTSCNDVVSYEEIDGRRIDVKKSINNSCSYVMFDDHEYVLYKNGSGSSICHSPKCHCLTDKK